MEPLQNRNEVETESNLDIGKRPLAIQNDTENKKKKVKLDPGFKVELPDEMWMKIMSYLNSQDLFQNISLVCKHLYNIHRSAAKYIEVNNVENKKNYNRVIRVLSDCKSLEMIKIEVKSSMMSYMDGIIKKALISCPKIKTLKLYSDQTICDNLTNPCLSMKNIGTFGKRLEYLEFNEIDIENKDFLSNLSELKSLRLPSYHRPKELISYSKFWPKLELIDFVDHAWCCEEEHSAKAAGLLDRFFSKRAPTLKELSLKLTYNDYFLKTCLRLCQNVEKFTAFRATIEEKHLKYISELPDLKVVVFHEMDLKCNMIFESDEFNYIDDIFLHSSRILNSFFENMNGKNLKCLVLSNCHGFNIISLIVLSMQQFPELEELYISKQSIIEHPEICITRLIQNCPKLKHIHLKGGFANIHNEFLLQMFKEFSVCITIEARVLSSGKKYISKKKSFEDYMKKYDLQLLDKYRDMEQQSKWLAK